MSSSFRRHRKAESLTLPGTKPFTGGISLTSTGLRDLDAILGAGAGQPLGTVLWVDEDRWTRSLANCLVRYWCAESLSQEQCLLIPIIDENENSLSEGKSNRSPWEEEEDEISSLNTGTLSAEEEVMQLLKSLPRNLHFDKYAQAQNAQAGVAPETAKPLDTLAEEEDDDEDFGEGSKDDNEEEGLKIAWQYRKSVQQERLGGASTAKAGGNKTGKKEFCHSYDLQGRLSDQISVLEQSTILRHVCQVSKSPFLGVQWFQTIRTKIDAIMSEKKQLIRVLLYRTKQLDALSMALPLLISYIRQHQLPVVIIVANQPWTHQEGDARSKLNALKRLSDVVLEAEGFASRREYPPPSEFRMFQGLLQIRKLSTVTAATANQGGGHFADRTNNRQPAADLYGLKRDRRKLNIQLLHIPPEEYVEGGGSVGGGAVRSGAGRPSSDNSGRKKSNTGGMSCASSGGALDF